MGERQTSLLTKSQREHLKDPKPGASGRMARKRIKERVHAGLQDFPLLTQAYERENLAEAFDDRNLAENEHTLNVLSSAFAFLYLGITDTVEPEDLAKDAFEDMIASGVQEAYRVRGEPVADVSVSVDVTPIDSSKPVEDMTLEEIREHAKAEGMDPQIVLQRLTEAFGEKREDNDSEYDVYDLDLSEADGFALPDGDDYEDENDP